MKNTIIDLFLIKATDIKDSEKNLFCSKLTENQPCRVVYRGRADYISATEAKSALSEGGRRYAFVPSELLTKIAWCAEACFCRNILY